MDIDKDPPLDRAGQASASIVIPAHNEQASISRLLHGLIDGARDGEFEIIVVSNGSVDATVAVARGFGSAVTVIETPEPSKGSALRLGDAIARNFPRLYIDADVGTTSADVRMLVLALSNEAILAVAPARRLVFAGESWIVRWYYAVWEQLPQVREGLFGRGVVAVSEEGFERIQRLPLVMSDDLAMSEAFTQAERRIVTDATVRISAPRTARDLLRRRTRVATGTAQLDQIELRSPQAQTTLSTLVTIACQHPRLIPKIALFGVVGIIAKFSAARRVRRGDFTTWLRDESSRDIP